MDGLSLADVSAMTNKDGFLEGNGIIILILFFLLLGGGGMFGNNKDIATASQVYDATNQQSMTNALNEIKSSICSSTYENANLINGINANMTTNTNAITLALNNGFNNVSNQITSLGYQMSQCCCGLKTQMLQDKYEDVSRQLNLAEMSSANAYQTQNILSNLGRFIPYGSIPYYGTTTQA